MFFYNKYYIKTSYFIGLFLCFLYCLLGIYLFNYNFLDGFKSLLFGVFWGFLSFFIKRHHQRILSLSKNIIILTKMLILLKDKDNQIFLKKLLLLFFLIEKKLFGMNREHLIIHQNWSCNNSNISNPQVEDIISTLMRYANSDRLVLVNYMNFISKQHNIFLYQNEELIISDVIQQYGEYSLIELNNIVSSQMIGQTYGK